MNKFRQAAQKLTNNLRTISFEGLGITVILIFIGGVLIANIFRVIEKGNANYEIYEYESNLLKELKGKNEELKAKLEYVNSNEFKQVLARDVLGLAMPNEELYSIKYRPSFLDEKKKLININESKEIYSEWWRKLLNL